MEKVLVIEDTETIRDHETGIFDADYTVIQVTDHTASREKFAVKGVSLDIDNLTLREARDRVEQGVISAAIDASRGNLTKASRQLGISRPTLYDLMKKHGLAKP